MRCNYCEWRCDLNENKHGVCKMYYEEKGVIKERFPNRWCTCGISKIESIPFYHAYPGSKSMVIGTSSCNFDCRYCSNSYIAKEEPAKQQEGNYEFTPEELVRMAQKQRCHNIVFNVNEPTVSMPSLIEVSQAAKKAGMSMGCLTNAYMTEEASDIIASIFSFINISLKGMAAEFYREYIGIKDGQPILRNIKRLARTNHIEVTVPVIQTINDHELDEMAGFLAEIDRDIPFHVFRLLPEYKMKDCEYPSIDRINESLMLVREKLNYVYFHNFVGSDWVNTVCPDCGAEVIERLSLGCGGDRLTRFHCLDNHCQVCGREISLLGSKTDWNIEGVLL
ncbi:MAG: radical SAM protein [Syntrophomonadaceae bacterium]|nr:radical SAM protein [Syntrophomonadaceae bacterium]